MAIKECHIQVIYMNQFSVVKHAHIVCSVVIISQRNMSLYISAVDALSDHPKGLYKVITNTKTYVLNHHDLFSRNVRMYFYNVDVFRWFVALLLLTHGRLLLSHHRVGFQWHSQSLVSIVFISREWQLSIVNSTHIVLVLPIARGIVK